MNFVFPLHAYCCRCGVECHEEELHTDILELPYCWHCGAQELVKRAAVAASEQALDDAAQAAEDDAAKRGTVAA